MKKASSIASKLGVLALTFAGSACTVNVVNEEPRPPRTSSQPSGDNCSDRNCEVFCYHARRDDYFKEDSGEFCKTVDKVEDGYTYTDIQLFDKCEDRNNRKPDAVYYEEECFFIQKP
ncbi:MAG: hypothetical protein OXT65_10820 [Alphaproteobacteria bacterium]|nr:hypothetical protein [Alphaproteobacteria bacterium]